MSGKYSYLPPKIDYPNITPNAIIHVMWVLPLPAWCIVFALIWLGGTLCHFVFQKIRQSNVHSFIDKVMIATIGIASSILAYPLLLNCLNELDKEMRKFLFDLLLVMLIIALLFMLGVIIKLKYLDTFHEHQREDQKEKRKSVWSSTKQKLLSVPDQEIIN